MKPLWSTLIGLVILAAATSASAHIVEITTSIPAVKAADDDDLAAALQSAIHDAVNAISFTPTVVTLQHARVVGDRIYIQLLVVDRDGEELMKQLATDHAESPPSASPDLDGPEATKL